VSAFKWIWEKQPLLVLCGHIHENFRVTGSWRAEIGRTTVIQPGQFFMWKETEKKKTTFVVIEITGSKVKAERFEI
jgi:Icc-related predicted phosphoesterase